MTPFERALAIVTEYEAAGETSAARMLLLTRIEDLCEVAEAARHLVGALTAAWPQIGPPPAPTCQGRARDVSA